MSNIKPFQAIHYNPKKIADFTDVVCPPYDVISEDACTAFQNKSPYNFTHIDLPKDTSKDKDSRYASASKIFDEWMEKEIMVRDDEPGIYFYKQEYLVQGQKHSRTGFISLMRLHDESDSKVHAHEKTHANAVSDRYKLTQSLNANLSCIFVCYSDGQKKVEKIFNKYLVMTDPLIDVKDGDNGRNRLWKFSDKAMIEEIDASLSNQNLFIADGHHRYQVACNHRREQLKNIKNPTGEEACNFVMTYFTNLDSKDLQIFPMHRIVRKVPKDLSFLEELFRIDKVKSKEELLIFLAKAGMNEHAFGMYTKDGITMLRLKNKSLIEDFVKEGSSEYKHLDAVILKSFIFDRLGIASDDNIIYTKDLSQVTDMVDEGEADAGFILNAVKISELKAIALNGERMPPKTTYFYPKVLSGLTVYKMD